MSDPRFVVGIDLGTSNCALAFADLAAGREAAVCDFPIPQVVRPGTVTGRAVLPSCLYLPAPGEFAPGAAALPWNPEPDALAGEWAREQGAKVPGRLVSSAKSWLCHPGVDREAAILPWGVTEEFPRISPVEASARLLRHLAGAWDAAHPDHPLSRQEVVLTVPASFDAVARALTERAARAAGLEALTLVEEPQAAFGEFLARHRDGLEQALEGIRCVLVVDVGGGTTDFTLIRVEPSPSGPELRRVAVGDHLMLGGDNMDAAVARHAERLVGQEGRRLGPSLWAQWVQACRGAKEVLLGAEAPDEFRVAVVGEGSRLVGSAVAVTLRREDIGSLLLDGFLPRCGPGEGAGKGARVGLHELGLPYAADPAITRQLVSFLKAHAPHGSPGLPRPDAILVNGGVFRSEKLTGRLREVVGAWWPELPPPPIWSAGSLDLAVARGAAAHGLARRGWGRRIGGGTGHAYYVGFQREEDGAARALCVIPRGHEEGRAMDLERVFRLRLGEPVRFPLFGTTADRTEAAGAETPVDEDLHPVAALQAVLRSRSGAAGVVPVRLRARLTEVGTLELACVAEGEPEPWRLEFALRGGATGPAAGEPNTGLPARFGEAQEVLEALFGKRNAGGDLGPGKPAWARLERSLGPREEWSLPVLRALWQVLLEGAGRRRRSADHERYFFQLAGFLLRPGFGDSLDGWRCEQMAPLFNEGVQFSNEKATWTEFWVMWRRISGGLTPERQLALWTALRPHLFHRLAPGGGRPASRPRGVQPEGLEEMVRLAASLEHLPAGKKGELGGWFIARLESSGGAGGPWAWALGRVGARVPLYASSHQVVPASQAADWVNRLLAGNRWKAEGALFALVQLARRSGDRARDLDEAVREAAVRVLRSAGAPPAWVRLVVEVSEMDRAERARALGDTLPLGLLG